MLLEGGAADQHQERQGHQDTDWVAEAVEPGFVDLHFRQPLQELHSRRREVKMLKKGTDQRLQLRIRRARPSRPVPQARNIQYQGTNSGLGLEEIILDDYQV